MTKVEQQLILAVIDMVHEVEQRLTWWSVKSRRDWHGGRSQTAIEMVGEVELRLAWSVKLSRDWGLQQSWTVIDVVSEVELKLAWSMTCSCGSFISLYIIMLWAWSILLPFS